MAGTSDAPSRKLTFKLTDTCKIILHRISDARDLANWKIDGHRHALVHGYYYDCKGRVDPINISTHDVDKYGGVYEVYKAARLQKEPHNFRVCDLADAILSKIKATEQRCFIHTNAPVYGNTENAKDLLAMSYRKCLALAKENDIKYIAFPSLSCEGVLRVVSAKDPTRVIECYADVQWGANIALDTIRENAEGLNEVHLLVMDYNNWNQYWDVIRQQNLTSLE